MVTSQNCQYGTSSSASTTSDAGSMTMMPPYIAIPPDERSTTRGRSWR